MILKEHSLKLVKINGYQTTELVKEKSKRYETLDRKVKNPNDIYKIMSALEIQKNPNEKLYCIYLNSKNMIISVDLIHIGGLNTSLVYPISCLAPAIHHKNCSKIIMVHNHPSGDTTPSEADTMISERMKICCELIGLKFLDSIIVGDDFCSIFDNTEY